MYWTAVRRELPCDIQAVEALKRLARKPFRAAATAAIVPKTTRIRIWAGRRLFRTFSTVASVKLAGGVRDDDHRPDRQGHGA